MSLPNKICASRYLPIYLQANTCALETRRDIFQAIADPTRRQIVGLLAAGALNLNAIAENFSMTRQAVSLHVKILTECGLVEVTTQGRERFCTARLDKLSEVSAWVDQYRKHWEHRLDSLEKYLHQLQKQRKHDQRKK